MTGIPSPASRPCTNCGAEVISGDRFCASCGNAVGRTCQECGTPLMSGDRFCVSCGAPQEPTGPDRTSEFASLWASILRRLRAGLASEYRITRELGRGGQAAVFLAEERSLHRQVAIKVLAPGTLSDDAAVDRFLREARTVAALEHENIVPIYAVRQVEELHCFIMRYIVGRSLAAIIDDCGPLPLNVIRAIAFQVGVALQYAHRKGVVHRDVKPANVLFSEEGSAIVTDFGIAKDLAGTHATVTGMLMGTPAYMSPEQCRQEGLSWSSDQYSLGIVLYEMLTGTVPFEGMSLDMMIGHTDREPPAIRSRRTDCPVEMEWAVLRMLKKRPSERWRTMGEALEALGARPLAMDDPIRQTLRELALQGHQYRGAAVTPTPTSPSKAALSREMEKYQAKGRVTPRPVPPKEKPAMPPAVDVRETAEEVESVHPDSTIGVPADAIEAPRTDDAARPLTEPAGDDVAAAEPEADAAASAFRASLADVFGPAVEAPTWSDATDADTAEADSEFKPPDEPPSGVHVAIPIPDSAWTAPPVEETTSGVSADTARLKPRYDVAAGRTRRAVKSGDARRRLIKWSTVGLPVVLIAFVASRFMGPSEQATLAAGAAGDTAVPTEVLPAAPVAPPPDPVSQPPAAGAVGDTTPRVRISGAQPILVTDETFRLRATYTRGSESANPPEPIRWQSSNPAVIRIDQDGAGSTVGQGDAIVRAIAGPASTEVGIRVVARVPARLSLDAPQRLTVGENRIITVTARDQRGAPIPAGRLAWQVSDTRIASIDQNGRLSALRDGTIRLEVRAGEAMVTHSLTVDPAPADPKSDEPTAPPLSATLAVGTKACAMSADCGFRPVTTSGGTTPYRYSISPALPRGLSLDAASGAITGSATAALPETRYTITATDQAGATSRQSFQLSVAGPSASPPAEPVTESEVVAFANTLVQMMRSKDAAGLRTRYQGTGPADDKRRDDFIRFVERGFQLEVQGIRFAATAADTRDRVTRARVDLVWRTSFGRRTIVIEFVIPVQGAVPGERLRAYRIGNNPGY
ncbi:MAG TPA: protein kinase [Gemmatimonadaceae bacterium]